MNLRVTMLLSLTGLAACSNTTSEPAREPEQVGASLASDAEMRPASLDEGRAPATGSDVDRGRDATATTASPTGADTRAPYAADGSTGSTTTREMGTGAPSADTARAANQPPTATGKPAAGTQPDNTKVNERDTNAAALTPVDQGNNESDLKITQQIRQAVMANDALSFTAKNVKIITNGGKVTLRGPVKTTAERDAIDAAARKVAGNQVDNQIEVKK